MKTEMPLIVRYAETDAQGVAHHANYLIWFEEGRSDALRQNGLHYTDFEKAGYFLVVAEANVRYKAPIFYEDQLTIETTLTSFRSRIMKFSYRVLDKDGKVRAEGETAHVVVGPDKRPTALPDSFIEQLEKIQARDKKLASDNHKL
ncbi:MAG: acyl-CoA thioesterase [Desulfuromonas sp.]|nr:MAG: acyl-CoA thioesterase [Desulfuromonas sp.]